MSWPWFYPLYLKFLFLSYPVTICLVQPLPYDAMPGPDHDKCSRGKDRVDWSNNRGMGPGYFAEPLPFWGDASKEIQNFATYRTPNKVEADKWRKILSQAWKKSQVAERFHASRANTEFIFGISTKTEPGPPLSQGKSDNSLITKYPSGQWTVECGRWTVDSRQWTMNCALWVDVTIGFSFAGTCFSAISFKWADRSERNFYTRGFCLWPIFS